ncbi:MAG: FtsX-like permease family protein [Gammaproteobacteria bacterium]|nr:FtsX-like permease family protein [Gammaproteobacteria bacterium]MDH3373561.1 FtsX-like permease family protein [Gammaproteobacteria bacterium]MDH3408689.1 FtsX-like permease family protein [Gammaproteobacteria bacterium]MDH3552286.1 FtsX-like permease family protein [Gammaproteobacteria bacterium]
MHRLAILFRLAWRNLWRNHRRTLIMLMAVVLGTWAMIFMTALMRGMVTDVVKDGISALPGHVQAHHPDYRDDPSVANLIAVSDAELAARFSAAGFVKWATRVRVPAVITSEYDSRGVTLLGVDPMYERDLTFVDYDEVTGRFLQSADDSGIVIGAKLAETLNTEVGKRIVLMSQNPDNDIADRGFRVIGLFKANIRAFEENYVFAGKITVQKMLGIGDQVSELVVLADDYRNVEAEYNKTVELIDGGGEVKRWFELDPYLGSMLGVMDGFVLVWIIVIFLALSFGLVNTLVMAVFERVREIGLMLALGMRPMNILGQIVVESSLLLAIGLAIGTALSWASVQPIKDGIDISIVSEGLDMWGMSSVLYPELLLSDVILANVVVLLLGFLASLSPAWRAAHYEPIEAITKV